MQVFDHFPSKANAEKFAAIARELEQHVIIYEQCDELGLLPFVRLHPPIVIVAVKKRDAEKIRKIAMQFGGEFAVDD
jgi:hypothetical protein